MTQEQIEKRNEKIRQYYASEPAEKKAERVEKIKAYHQALRKKRDTANRARVARAEIERTINTLRYIIGETDSPTPENNE